MRILDRYIVGGYVVTFAVSALVVTFVMCLMALFRIADFLAFGASWIGVLKFFLEGMPTALSFSIPVGMLVSSLLTFGRLSSYGEITAMRSSGLSMREIMTWPIFLSALMSIFCLYLNAELAPRMLLLQRAARWDLGVTSPLKLLEEGRFIRDFPGFTFYIGSKKNDELFDVIIYQQMGEEGKYRNIRAKRGTVSMLADEQALLIDLYDVRIDPWDDQHAGAGQAGQFPLKIDVSKGHKAQDKQEKRKSDLTLSELLQQIRSPVEWIANMDAEHIAIQKMSMIVEATKRVVLALSCFAFALLGIPLATKTERRESSVGIGISIVLVFVFYLFIILAESLEKQPQFQPYVIACLPLLLSVILGGYLVHRCE